MPLGAFRQSLNLATPAAAAGPTTITYQYARTASGSGGVGTVSNTLTLVGDIAVLFSSSTIGATPNLPAGWIQIADQTVSTTYRTTVSYRIIQAGDIGTSIPAGTGGTVRGVALFFRPNSTINGVVIGGLTQQGTIGTPVSQTLTVSGTPNLPAIGFASYVVNASGFPLTRGWSVGTPVEVISAGNGQFTKHLVYPQPTTPTNTVISQSDSGDNVLISFYMSFT